MTTFKQAARRLSMVGVLATFLGLASAQSVAAAGIGDLSPADARLYQALLAYLPADQAALTRNAVAQLTPVSFRTEMNGASAMRQYGLLLPYLATLSTITAALPPNARQPFVDGAWGVTPSETLFASQVVSYLSGSAQPASPQVIAGLGLPANLEPMDPGLVNSWIGVGNALGGNY